MYIYMYIYIYVGIFHIYIYIAGSMSHLQTGMHQVDPPGLAKTYAMILRASA